MRKTTQQITAFLLAASLCLGLAGCAAGDTAAAPSASAETAEEPAAPSAAEAEPTATPEPKAPELTHIDVPEPNNTATNGYKESGNYESRKEALAAKNLQVYKDDDGNTHTTYSGHTIYLRPYDVGEVAQDQVGTYQQKCIVSGVEVFDVDNDTEEIIFPYDTAQLRKEGSCERIYIYSEDEYNDALEYRDQGQKYLSGAWTPNNNCIVLNGSFVPYAEYTVGEDGELYVPLLLLSIAYSSDTLIDDTNHVLRVPGAYQITESFPSAETTPEEYARCTFNNTINGDGTFNYVNTFDMPLWNDNFAIPSDSDFTVPVEEVARIMGWDFYYGDGILSIVTDELDDTKPENILCHELQKWS